MGAALLVLAAATAHGQAFPSKPIRVINPTTPGGNSDIFFRVVSPIMTEELGRPLVMDYRGGAGGTVGADLIAKSPPDGYVVGVVAGSFMINPAIIRKLPYDTVRDFTALGLIVDVPAAMVVHPSLPAKNVKEFIALARARPGELMYSSVGRGTAGHLAAELLGAMAGIKLLQVSYRGAGQAIIDLIAGHTQLQLSSMPVSIEHVRAKRLRMLAQLGATRSATAPDVPTMVESGLPGFVVNSGFSFIGPAGIPRPVVERLNGALVRALRDPDNRRRLLDSGADPVASTPDAHAAYIKSEIAKWAKLARAAGIQPE